MLDQQRVHALAVRLQAVSIVATIVGSTLAFGGAVWWARIFLGVTLGVLAVATVVRSTAEGAFLFLRSPLSILGGLMVGLALLQLVPLPAAIARRLSPRAHQAHALGVLSDAARADNPDREPEAPPAIRTPATVDRSATLRWLVGAVGCLCLFCAVGGFANRLDRSCVVWGAVVGSVFLCATVGLIQLLGGTRGAYGFLVPGQSPAWAPTPDSVLNTPAWVAFRERASTGARDGRWAAAEPAPSVVVAGLPGGSGAYLALASLGLPLGFGLVLQMIAPRGARGSFWSRLPSNGHAGSAGVLFGLLILSTAMVGFLAGRMLAIPFVLGLLVCGLPSAWGTGLRGLAVAGTCAALLALASGVVLAERFPPSAGSETPAAGDWTGTIAVWRETARIARDFALVGCGMGGFASIHPYYKSADLSPTTALSSGLQWVAEAGIAGSALVLLGGLWVLLRLPGALRRVGSADRALAFGLLGSLVGFAAFSVVHWSIELGAVALAASAVLGTFHRWLAGGTDLFATPA